MAESGIETTAAPEWLVKLESRREQIKAKLGHESGNGAPCVVCESKCPGLDLHFWRKVCRNCKCRKEQHDCKDDDVTGWAQFEILGAIRSKSAYIKISELTDKPVQLDWIPPNVTPELASDYMSKLGEKNIPIAGSVAAEKRKQQLEYQVPPHDLDASLCHNLSENEASQLIQYVEKIKKNCVGQGNVVRVGDNISYLQKSNINTVPVPSALLKNALMKRLMSSELIQAAISGETVTTDQPLCLQNEAMKADFIGSPLLSDKTKYKLKLMKVNTDAIQSVVEHGAKLDVVFSSLNSRGIHYHEHCHLLGPLERLRFTCV
ncbi:testin isoform X2 [Wyeomyia smithii]|uniref:testin isoform X2 n=1 Tax=Wyeomyia smithii TaxID=174621 RepID=UPI002468099B|nr:testin isoform X2 [Wyeomyia smithii]